MQNVTNTSDSSSWSSSEGSPPHGPNHAPAYQGYSQASPSYAPSSQSYSQASPSYAPSSQSYSPANPTYAPSFSMYSPVNPTYTTFASYHQEGKTIYEEEHIDPAHLTRTPNPHGVPTVFSPTLIQRKKFKAEDFIEKPEPDSIPFRIKTASLGTIAKETWCENKCDLPKLQSDDPGPTYCAYVLNIPFGVSRDEGVSENQRRVAHLIHEVVQNGAFKGSPKEKLSLKNRLGMVIGFNTYRSIDPKQNTIIKELVANKTETDFPVEKIGFYWDLPWEEKTSNDKWKSVSYQRVASWVKAQEENGSPHFFNEIKKIEESWERKNIPFGNIRNKIKNSTPTRQLVSHFREYNPQKPVYLGILDADMKSMESLSEQGLLTRNDDTIGRWKSEISTRDLPEILSGGFRISSREHPLLNRIWEIYLKIINDRAQTHPHFNYCSEANTFIRIPEGQTTVPENFDKGSSEMHGLIKRLWIKRELDDHEDRMLFVSDSTITTTAPTRMIENRQGYVYEGKFYNWSMEDLIHLRDMSQSPIKPFSVFRTVVSGLSFSETANFDRKTVNDLINSLKKQYCFLARAQSKTSNKKEHLKGWLQNYSNYDDLYKKELFKSTKKNKEKLEKAKNDLKKYFSDQQIKDLCSTIQRSEAILFEEFQKFLSFDECILKEYGLEPISNLVEGIKYEEIQSIDNYITNPHYDFHTLSNRLPSNVEVIHVLMLLPDENREEHIKAYLDFALKGTLCLKEKWNTMEVHPIDFLNTLERDTDTSIKEMLLKTLLSKHPLAQNQVVESDLKALIGKKNYSPIEIHGLFNHKCWQTKVLQNSSDTAVANYLEKLLIDKKFDLFDSSIPIIIHRKEVFTKMERNFFLILFRLLFRKHPSQHLKQFVSHVKKTKTFSSKVEFQKISIHFERYRGSLLYLALNKIKEALKEKAGFFLALLLNLSDSQTFEAKFTYNKKEILMFDALMNIVEKYDEFKTIVKHIPKIEEAYHYAIDHNAVNLLTRLIEIHPLAPFKDAVLWGKLQPVLKGNQTLAKLMESTLTSQNYQNTLKKFRKRMK